MRHLQTSQKTSYTVKEAKCNHFSNVFFICMNRSTKIYRTLKEMTGKRSVRTNQNINNEKKDNIKPPTIIADMFNKKFVNFATTVAAAQLRGMQLAPNSKKDTLMPRKNSNTSTINQTLISKLLDYFQLLCKYTDT